MKYIRERNLLQTLCKDFILELIENVGWNDIQIKIIKARYIAHKSVKRTRIDLYLTSATYVRYFDSAMQKLQVYLENFSKDKIFKYYWVIFDKNIALKFFKRIYNINIGRHGTVQNKEKCYVH